MLKKDFIVPKPVILKLGWFAILTYCITTALSAVWVNHSFSNINSEALVFFTIFVAQIFFTIISILKKEKTFQFIKDNFFIVMILNTLTLVSWLFMFISLQKIEASVESAIYQGCIPVIVVFIEFFIYKKRPGILFVTSIIALAVGLGLLSFSKMYQDSVIDENMMMGVLYACVAGITAAFYIVYSEHVYSEHHISIINILSSRFIMLIAYTYFIGQDSIHILYQTNLLIIGKLIILALMLIVLPIYLLQYSIVTLGSSRVSILTPLVPSIALGVEHTYISRDSNLIPSLVIVVCVCVLLANYFKSKG